MEKDRDAFREQIRKLEQTIAARQLKEVAFEKEIAKAKEALKNMEILAKKYQDQVLKIIKQNKELSAAVVQLGGIETLNQLKESYSISSIEEESA